MRWKESRWYSILHLKCPRCHEGDMFVPGSWYKPSSFSKMNDQCPCCGQSFEPEPGFYYGAMYVSFAINTAIFVGVWLLLTLLFAEVTLLMMLTAILLVVGALFPVIFRLSRSLWINIFIGYEGPCRLIRQRKHAS